MKTKISPCGAQAQPFMAGLAEGFTTKAQQTRFPWVTVVIPTFNRKFYLKNALESVLGQTYTHYEVIIIDDGSTDETFLWVREHYPQFYLIENKKNRGGAYARNLGIKAAKGEYIAFLDSDDVWRPQFLSKHIQILQGNQDAVFSWCDCTEVIGSRMQRIMGRPIFQKDLALNFLLFPFIHTMSAVVVKKEALFRTGLFNEGLAINHDDDLYMRLCHFGEVVNIPEELVIRYRHSHNNLTSDLELRRQDDQNLPNYFFSNNYHRVYRCWEREIRQILRYKQYYHYTTDYKIFELWKRRILFNFNFTPFKQINRWKIFLADMLSVLAFIKQQFLGLKNQDSLRFFSLKEKWGHFLYLNRLVFDSILWGIMRYGQRS